MPLYSKGYTGEDVERLQSMLNVLYKSQPLAVDGRFGPLTEACVKKFQQDTFLAPDGVVGPLTLAALVDATLSALQ